MAREWSEELGRYVPDHLEPPPDDRPPSDPLTRRSELDRRKGRKVSDNSPIRRAVEQLSQERMDALGADMRPVLAEAGSVCNAKAVLVECVREVFSRISGVLTLHGVPLAGQPEIKADNEEPVTTLADELRPLFEDGQRALYPPQTKELLRKIAAVLSSYGVPVEQEGFMAVTVTRVHEGKFSVSERSTGTVMGTVESTGVSRTDRPAPGEPSWQVAVNDLRWAGPVGQLFSDHDFSHLNDGQESAIVLMHVE